MKKKFLLFIVILLLFVNCISLKTKKNLKNDPDDEIFLNEAFKYYSQKKYSLLNLLSNYKLTIDPKSYKAAYFKAFAIQHSDKKYALSYYLSFINENSDIPDYYHKRWIEFALNLNNNKKISIINNIDQLINEKTIDFNENHNPNGILPKINIIKDNYVYLDNNGALYIINNNLNIKKINYHKTKDFIILNDCIIFNDSINLFKYEILTEKYLNIHTFQEDEIYIINYDILSNLIFIKHKEGDIFLSKLIDLKTNEVKNFPNNCIAQSDNFKYIILEYENKFNIYTIDGNLVSELKGKFLDFNSKFNELFFYDKNYLCSYQIEENTINKILFIPDIKKINKFKTISYNKIIFSFDDYILYMPLYGNSFTLINGNLINLFQNGFIYNQDNDKNIYYHQFFTNSKILLFKNFESSDILKSSNSESTYFTIKKNNKLFIYNLNKIKI